MAASTFNEAFELESGLSAHPVAWIQDLDIWLCSKCGKRIIPPFDRNHFGNAQYPADPKLYGPLL